MLRFCFLNCLYSRRCLKTIKYYTRKVLEGKVRESETYLGLITGLEGLISCTATQSNPEDTTASAFGEYDYVHSN